MARLLSVDPAREHTGPAPAARLTTLVAGLANGLWVVAAGLGVVASGVLLAWLGSGAQAPFVDVLRVIGLGWGFGTGATLQTGDVAWSLTPLGLTLLTIALAYRGGLWAADTARPLTAQGLGVLVAGSVVSSTALAWAIAAGSGLAGTTLDPVQAAGRAGLLCGVGALIGGVAAAPELRAHVAGALPAWLRAAPSSTALACAVLVVGAAGALTLTMVVSFGAVTSLLEQLAPDPGGLFALLLICLAYVPTALVWTLAVLVGPGMGIGSVVVTSSSVTTGPLPGFPLLGLVPETMPMWVVPAGIVLLLVAGVLAGHHAARQTRPADESAPVWAPVASAAVAGAGVTGAVALACVAASGSMGPGGLAQVGPPAGAVTAVCGLAVTASATATAAVIRWRRRSRPEA